MKRKIKNLGKVESNFYVKFTAPVHGFPKFPDSVLHPLLSAPLLPIKQANIGTPLESEANVDFESMSLSFIW